MKQITINFHFGETEVIMKRDPKRKKPTLLIMDATGTVKKIATFETADSAEYFLDMMLEGLCPDLSQLQKVNVIRSWRKGGEADE